MNSPKHCNLSTLFQALRSNILGESDGNLLRMKILKTEVHQATLLSARHDALCLRFLQLFQPQTYAKSLTLITNSMATNGAQNLLALLDLPFTFLEKKDDLNRSILRKDFQKYDFLTVAVEKNNIEALSVLLKLSLPCDADTTPSDLAWQLQHLKCLTQLISSDFPFPKVFQVQNLNPNHENLELRRICYERISFHAAITLGSFEVVKDFLKNNHQLKFAFDLQNNSALVAALKAKQFGIFSYLQSSGYRSKTCENVDGLIAKSLSDSERSKIRDENRKYFVAFDDSHVINLLGKSKLGFTSKDREACFTAIREMFEELNGIFYIKPILQAVQYCDKLEIVFDFNKEHVAVMDPTKSKHTKGTTYPGLGCIYVAAKYHRKNFSSIVGTLVHEITHLVMQLIFQNDCKPYSENDTASRNHFYNITLTLKHHVEKFFSSTDLTISSVFFSYPKEIFHAELIVRVPQLFALYKNNESKLFEIKNSYCHHLFEFYSDFVLPKIQSQLRFIKPKQEIREINLLSGVLEKSRNLNIRLTEEKVLELESLVFASTKLKLFQSNSPTLTLAFLAQMLIKKDFSCIFIEVKDFQKLKTKVKFAANSEVNPFLVVDCSKTFDEYLFDGFQDSRKIISITQSTVESIIESTEQSSSLQSFELYRINHKWIDLDQNSQESLLEKEISFQRNAVKLSQLVSHNSSALKFLNLNDLFSDKLLLLESETLNESLAFYINRTFNVEKMIEKVDEECLEILKIENLPKRDLKTVSTVMDLNELLQEAEQNKVMLISGLAGTGKSATLCHICKTLKQMFPTRWISFVNLKAHIDSFDAVQKQSDLKQTFQGFLSKLIFKFKEKFTEELFLQLFNEEKTTILFDGIDEISPKYKELILPILSLFDKSSGNQLWITSRLHLKQDLEESFGISSCSIYPLTNEDQTKFIVKFWSKQENVSFEENVEETAKKLVSKLNSIIANSSSLIGIPLLVRMIAEIYQDGLIASTVNETIDSIYKHFIKKLFHIWRKNKGKLSDEDQEEIDMTSNHGVMEVHQIISLKYFFGSDMIFNYDEDEWSNEKISRVGIIHFDDMKIPRFLHETFAEYFVGEFIFSKLKSSNEISFLSQLFFNVLENEQHQMIRLFLNQTLKKIELKEEKFNKFASSLIVYAEEKKCHTFLSVVLKENLENLVNFLLTVFKNIENENFIKSVLTNKTKNGETILMLASKSESLFQHICAFTSTRLTVEEARSLCCSKTTEDLNIISYLVSENGNNKQLKQVTEFISSISTKDDMKNFMINEENSLLCLTVEKNTNKNVMKSLWKFAQNILSSYELKVLLEETDNEGQNPLQKSLLLKNKFFLVNYIKVVVNFLSQTDQKILFKHCDSLNLNIFHFSVLSHDNCEMFTAIWNFSKNILTNDELKSMLLHKSDERNVLHTMIIENNENAVEKFLEIVD